MTRRKEIETINRETEALAERLTFRIHAIALVLTAIVLTMRLIAGREQITPSTTTWDDPNAETPAVDAPVLLGS
jgi:hypothetical protein